MIHRESRDRISVALRRYTAGMITNDELDCVDVDWRDRGAVAVKERAWGLYDDMNQHKAKGKYYLDKQARREIAKWIIFLHSDKEYLWPEYSFIQFGTLLFDLLTFGWWGRNKSTRWDQFVAAGDFNAWPFISDQDLSNAIDSPKLLMKRQFQSGP